jgi:HK97 family phage prohead protease
MKTKSNPLSGNGILFRGIDIKELTETGSFEGLASVYGNLDLGGDVVMPGAFKEFVYTKDNHIRILDGHDTRRPIGKGKVIDTHMGLALKGQLSMQVARAREVHALMKDGIIDGLSIGYDILPGGAKINEQNIRELHALKLWEVSTTAFPMNQAALVDRVKSVEVERCKSVRELEDLLRDAAGLSRAQAKLHAGAIWKTIGGQRDAGEEVEETVQRIQDLLKTYS